MGSRVSTRLAAGNAGNVTGMAFRRQKGFGFARIPRESTRAKQLCSLTRWSGADHGAAQGDVSRQRNEGSELSRVDPGMCPQASKHQY